MHGHDGSSVKVVTVGLDGGGSGPAAVEWDEESRSGQVTLLTPAPPEAKQPIVRKVEEPIVFTPAQTEQSFRLLRSHLSSQRRAGTADARIRQAAGQVFRSLRRFNLLRHRPAARPVKARAQAAPRSRRTRSAAASRGRPRKPDDDVDPPGRRCPRCGGAVDLVRGSAVAACGHCYAQTWERMVAHEFERVLAEAERALRGEAA